MRRGWGAACALLLAAAAALQAQDVQVTVDRADLERGEQSVAVIVGGAVPGLPDRTRVRVRLTLGKGSLQQFAEVGNGRFTARLGPFKARVLPATYDVIASIESSVQRNDIAPLVAARKITSGTLPMQVGTPEEAAAERDKLRKRYVTMLEDMKMLRAMMEMSGSTLVHRSISVRMRNPRGVPDEAVRPLESEWRRFTEEEFEPILASLRYDQRQLGEYVLLGYFPDLEAIVTEMLTTLDRCHAGFGIVMYNNMGRKPPEELASKGGLSLDDLRRNLLTLARQAYVAMDLEPDPWRLIDGSVPERPEDAVGDLFHSTVTKFEVRKPPEWKFDVRTPRPSMRLAMYPPGQEKEVHVMAGVALHDFPMAESFDDLARLDEAATRQTHPGFELKKIKRISSPDATMPTGLRPGQEIRFTTTMGGNKKYSLLQYSLFCRWHKRTYTVLCIAELGLEGAQEAAFKTICESFKVLDAPQVVERERPERPR